MFGSLRNDCPVPTINKRFGLEITWIKNNQMVTVPIKKIVIIIITQTIIIIMIIINKQMAVCQNLVPLVNIKIAGKWMFIPIKIVLIGIDPYPNNIQDNWTSDPPSPGSFVHGHLRISPPGPTHPHADGPGAHPGVWSEKNRNFGH
jgi:hypothetical protein